jgi:flagella basal body P-ring formation protein FlgA
MSMNRLVWIGTAWLACTIVSASAWCPSAASAHSAGGDVTVSGGTRTDKPHSAGRQLLFPDEIRKAIHRHLQQALAGRVQEIRVSLGEPQHPIGVPAGQISLTVSSPEADENFGRRVFQVHVAVNGRFLRTLEAVTDVAAYLDILTPVRLIKVDEEIDADDVMTTRMALPELPSPFATDPKDVIGKAASRPLPPQTPIRLTALRRPYVVRKGDRVLIEAKQGGLSIQTAGVTKANGELGQTITVSNTDSGKDLRAKVVGPGVVRVAF